VETTQTKPIGIDASAFGAIAAEIGRSLDKVAAALEGNEPLAAACRDLAQIRGVLEVAGLAVIARMVREVESMVGEIAGGAVTVTGDGMGVCRRALAAIRRAMVDLVAGSRSEPLEPALQGLSGARGADHFDEMKLFRPDLMRLPPERGGAQAAAADTESLRAARASFQKGLLAWLRNADANGPVALREVVSSIESSFTDPHARAPWWIATGFFDLLVEGKIEPITHAKRICSALDQYLRKVIDGAADPPESLMREMLYFIAINASTSERVAAVRQTYLTDVSTAATDAAGPLAPIGREQLQVLEQSWEKAVSGDAENLRMFLVALEEVSIMAPPDTGLGKLLEQMLRSVAQMRGQPAETQALLAVEMATALLFLQDALPAQPGAAAAFDPAAVDAMLRRLRAAAAGQIDQEALGVSLQSKTAQRTREQALADTVATEVLAALTAAAQGLEMFFADRTAHAGLDAADNSLARAGGVLQVMAEDRAAAAAGYCREQIARFRAGVKPVSEQDFARVAAVLAGLSYYVEQLRFGHPDFAAIMIKAGAPEKWIGGESELAAGNSAVAEVVDVTESMDPELPEFEEVKAAARPSLPEDVVPLEGWDQAADADLLRIFIDEAVAVLSSVRGAIARLHQAPADAGALATICRGFHTLKGSGRMVDLGRLADAAWEVERVMSSVIENRQPTSGDLIRLLDLACERCAAWIAELDRDGRAWIDADKLTLWAGQFRSGEPLHAEIPLAQRELAAAPVAETQRTEPPPAETTAVAPVIGQTAEIGSVRISRTLYELFMQEAQQLVEALQTELNAMKAHPKHPANHDLLRFAHTLSGIAGTVRVASIQQLAGAMEDVAELLHREALDTLIEDKALFEEALAALQGMIASVGAGEQPQPRADLESALKSLAKRLADQSHAAGRAELDIGEETAAIRIELAGASSASAEQGLAPSVSTVRPDRRRHRLQDDIDTNLLPVFLEEAADLVPRIGQELRGWRARPDERSLPQSLARLLHTLKGSARMAGAMGLGELTHSMETRISVAAQLAVIPESVFEGLEQSYDRIGMLLEALAPQKEAKFEGHRAGGESMPADSAAAPTLDSTVPPSLVDSTEARTESHAAPDTVHLQPAAQTAPEQAVAQSPRAQSLLRVRADLVEQLVAEAGEVAITRSRLEVEMRAIRGGARDMSRNLTRLRALSRELEIQAQSQMQSRMVAHGTDDALDPLEFDRFTRLQELTRFIAESAGDVATLQQNMSRNVDSCEAALAAQARMTRILQDGLMGVRMIPFGSLSERLFRVVRLTAREAGKRVKLDIRGDKLELDRGVIERITGPLEHLLRNAVVHGIETTEQRLAAGKPAAGEITLDVRQEGNEVLLTLQDDGRGLDIAALRAKAIAAGLMKADLLLADAQVVQFAFAAGVSTAQNVTEAAGRGVGLDVVRSEVAALGGRVDVSFEPDKGTAFSVHLPLMVAVMQALLLRCGGQLFALPTLMVEQVRTVAAPSLARLYEVGQVEWRGRAFAMHDLRALLGLEAEAPQGKRRTPLVLVRGGARRVAVQVDEILANEEVVVKNIGAQVARVSGITGAVVRGGGEIVLILDPVQLTQRSPAPRPAVLHAGEKSSETDMFSASTVMVVDDSATVRKITSRILARQGYKVLEARDGIEALEKLQGAVPAVMLLDVEMPRMDGFELLRRVRDDSRWREMPVIMITSRTAEKHRKVAMELGATLFLGKPFEEQDLLAQVARVTTKAKV
jgi:chemosensory pili system protein ChpA (sensor histidine kinase/response regulator)